MSELEYYSNIEYTAGWYYNQFPKFYNIECYRILADFSNNPERYLGVEEVKESEVVLDMEEDKNPSNKRGIDQISSAF
jgi:hypothetical protein